MYAVIKTGGKQYRVQPGDLLVVEKLDGDVGAEVAFDQVLMVGGDGGDVTVGAPTVAGAVVRATLIETRKGDKVKIFKKIRRQGYRRTRGHRQQESVLRVTGLEGAGQSIKWDGKVDLTPKSELDARARGLAAVASAPVVAEAAPAPAPAAKAPKAKAAPAPAAEEAVAAPAVTEAPAAPVEAEAAPAPAPKKAKAPKAEAAPAAEGEAEAKPAKKPAAKKAAKPASDEA